MTAHVTCLDAKFLPILTVSPTVTTTFIPTTVVSMSYQARPAGSQMTGGGISGLGARNPVMEYICADCAATNEIRPREPIRCRECGHRVMYKKRTKRMVSQRSVLSLSTLVCSHCLLRLVLPVALRGPLTHFSKTSAPVSSIHCTSSIFYRKTDPSSAATANDREQAAQTVGMLPAAMNVRSGARKCWCGV